MSEEIKNQDNLPLPEKPRRGGAANGKRGGSEKGVTKPEGTGCPKGYSREPREKTKALLLETIDQMQATLGLSLFDVAAKNPWDFWKLAIQVLTPRDAATLFGIKTNPDGTVNIFIVYRFVPTEDALPALRAQPRGRA